jgi:hypothetical protein
MQTLCRIRLLPFIRLHSIKFKVLVHMWEERESFLTKRYNSKAPSAKSNKKSNITLSIDTETLNMLKNTAEVKV